MVLNVISGSIGTKYGKVSTDKADFGYGMIWLEGDEIVYQDVCGFKSWKTVRGFERWVAKQNAINGGVYKTIDNSMCKHVKTINSWC